MKQADGSEPIVKVLARMCRLENEAECRSQIDQWRRHLPSPKLEPGVSTKNCMHAKAKG